MNTMIDFEKTRNEARRETGRWLGKAIGLVREPRRTYVQHVQGLWRGQNLAQHAARQWAKDDAMSSVGG